MKTIIFTFFYIIILLILLVVTLNTTDPSKSYLTLVTLTPDIPANCHFLEDGGFRREACDVTK